MQSANLSGPFRGCLYYALLGLPQATGLAGGYDCAMVTKLWQTINKLVTKRNELITNRIKNSNKPKQDFRKFSQTGRKIRPVFRREGDLPRGAGFVYNAPSKRRRGETERRSPARREAKKAVLACPFRAFAGGTAEQSLPDDRSST